MKRKLLDKLEQLERSTVIQCSQYNINIFKIIKFRKKMNFFDEKCKSWPDKVEQLRTIREVLKK